MVKIFLLDPLGNGKRHIGHCHYLRDWSGSYIPLYIAFAPLDQMYCAAFLRKNGHDVKIIESSVKHITHKKTVILLEQENPDIVLIPSTFISLEEDLYLSKLIKKRLPNLKIVFSGPLVTFKPSLALMEKSVDFVALGELELPLLDIANGITLNNIAYKNGDSIICGKRSLMNLNELPPAARDLISNDLYRYALFNKKNPVATMIISRGCPHSICSFCYANLYTLGKIRFRSFESIIKEIEVIVNKYKAGEIFFRDQAFTANRELVVQICNYLISNKIKILWRASTRVDLLDKNLVLLMHKAGCYQISLGFESYSQRVLDQNNKGITLKQSYLAAKWTKEAGIETLGFFLSGMKGEKRDSLKYMVKFSMALDVDFAQFNSVYAVPGSPIYRECKGKYFLPYKRKYLSRVVTSSYLKFYSRPKVIYKLINSIDSFEKLIISIKMLFSAIYFIIIGLFRN